MLACPRSLGAALGRTRAGQVICRPSITVGKGKNTRVITAASRGRRAFCFEVGAGPAKSRRRAKR